MTLGDFGKTRKQAKNQANWSIIGEMRAALSLGSRSSFKYNRNDRKIAVFRNKGPINHKFSHLEA